MKLKVLVDNNTCVGQYYLSEPGLSYYIEVDNIKILFDVGYSDVYIRNAKSMGIDLKQINTVVFSHGHDDHTKGTYHLYNEIDNINIVTHPAVFREDYDNYFPKELEGNKYNITLTKEPYYITPNLIYLGEIPQLVLQKIPVGEYNGEPDYVIEDSALVYMNKDEIFIITGCSHSGICNIIEYAKKVTGVWKISGVIGGLHLFSVDEHLDKTIQYFKDNNITNLYPSHCTSFKAKAKIHESIPVNDVWSGLELEI